ncbi:MAG: branched-chain amino acid ABC transporter permease [Bacteroidetes bacterium]|nr:branched-chain amino acid ABC transporter permease [Bacteroidota bacterium]
MIAQDFITLAQDVAPTLPVPTGRGSAAIFVQTLTKALALGSLYAILALGFVLIFKATQVLNFAHGAIAMAGALFLSILVADAGIPFLPFDNPLAPDGTPSVPLWVLNLIIALILTAILGLVLERVAIRPMVGQPLFSMAVITLGIEIAIRAFAVDASMLEARSLNVPWGTKAFTLGSAAIPWSYVAIYIAAVLAFVGVYFFYRSKLGVAMRAVSFDQEAAMAQGINVGRVFAIAWGFGAALACLGAVFFGLYPFLPNAVSVDQHPILAFRVLPVIVLGGLDSVQGALIGGLIIGAFEIFSGEYLSQYSNELGAGYQQIVPYLVMLVVLLVRPFGLFGTEEIRRV